jgi:ADP-heptose:LPS heptosyltransferase
MSEPSTAPLPGQPGLPIRPQGLPRALVTLSVDDRCALCAGPFIANGQLAAGPAMKSDRLGLVHSTCYMPYHPQDNVRVLFNVRTWSIGDTLTATPLLRHARRIYPKATINVLTLYPELFAHNPHINGILDARSPVPQAMVDAHEFQLSTFANDRIPGHMAIHSMDFAALSAFGRQLYPTEWEYELYYSEADVTRAKAVWAEAGIDPYNDRVIVLHPHGTEWSTRNWGPHRMPELAVRLADRYPGHRIVSIGGKRDGVTDHVMKNFVALPEAARAVDLYGKLSLLETAAILDSPCVKLLVTPDTGTLHLGATRPALPMVAIFTVIRAYFRTPVRHGELGYRFIPVEADSGCNCSYDRPTLTQIAHINVCPKRTFLQETLAREMPVELKRNGLFLHDRHREWPKDAPGLEAAVREEITRFPDEALPCFPSVDKVFRACVEALNQWGGEPA